MKPSWDDAPCYYTRCKKMAIAKGLCDRHYRRLKKYGWGEGFFRELHGGRSSAEYRIWSHMKGRCLNPGDASYKHYGARGITICDRWANDFSEFLNDMGSRPSENHQIDRIDNNLGYFKENCRWVLSAQNNQNRRTTKLTNQDVRDILGSKETGKIIAEKYGISVSQALRVRNGKRWSTSLERRP